MNNGKYSQEMNEKICKYVSLGLTNLQAANVCRISEQTFYQWVKTKPEFAESLKRARDEGEASNLAIIHKAKTKSWAAAAWLLERQHQDTYAIKTKIQHSGAVNTTLTSRLDLGKINQKTLEDLASKLDGLLRTKGQ